MQFFLLSLSLPLSEGKFLSSFLSMKVCTRTRNAALRTNRIRDQCDETPSPLLCCDAYGESMEVVTRTVDLRPLVSKTLDFAVQRRGEGPIMLHVLVAALPATAGSLNSSKGVLLEPKVRSWMPCFAIFSLYERYTWSTRSKYKTFDMFLRMNSKCIVISFLFYSYIQRFGHWCNILRA